MESVEELTAFLERVGQEGVRGRLQARGEARAIVRQDGVLPEGSPTFVASIDTDLAELGFSLLRASLALREADHSSLAAKKGFVRAGNAFESLVQNGSSDDVARGFNRVIGAASYHLAGYSALAFSLMAQGSEPGNNLAPAESAIVFLIMRDLDGLARQAKIWLSNPEHTDDALAAALQDERKDADDVITSVVTSTVFEAFAYFHFALQTGESKLIEEARILMGRALDISKHANAVSLWWISRVALNLIDDLWSNSMHEVLPKNGPPAAGAYAALRDMYIGELFARKISEVELWPSQIEAAKRAIDLSDDLVVALPTSAGKTRIAEIARTDGSFI